MKTLVPILSGLMLCASPASAIDANDLPDGVWAPSLSDCRDPSSPKLFELRMKAHFEAFLESRESHCKIAKVSDTAIGYRLNLRCYASPEDRAVDRDPSTRQVVVDAIGPITMRVDGHRVFRCASTASAAIVQSRTQPSSPGIVAIPMPDVPTRLASLPSDRDLVLPQDAVKPSIVSPRGGSPTDAVARPVLRGQIVDFAGRQEPGTIVVRTSERALFLVQSNGRAIRYNVAVGRPGAAWSGVETVTAKTEWPDWTPTPEMRQRKPGLPRHMSGGPRNPLGARALYLGSSAYRIHGTTDPDSIGRAASSGCIRMRNKDVIELYERVPVGTRVEVL